MTEEERTKACLEFCQNLSDEVLASANKAHFDALFLWQQRDAAFLQLATANVPILDARDVLITASENAKAIVH